VVSIRKQAPKLPKKIQGEINRLQKSKTAEVATGPDGTVTRSKTSKRGATETNQTLTGWSGKGLERGEEYRKVTTGADRQTDSTFTKKADLLGRETVASRKETTSQKGDTARRTVTTAATDVYGITKKGSERQVSSALEDGTRDATHAKTSDSRGNVFKASDVTTVRQQGEHTVTRNDKRTGGSQLETQSTARYEEGTFRLGGGADWKKGASVDRSFLKERDADPSKVKARADKIAKRADKVLDMLGLEAKEWSSEVSPDKMRSTTLAEGKYGSVTGEYGVSGGQSLSFDGKSISGTFSREARAGVYANSSGQVSGKYGEASYDATAKAEATASVDAKATLNTNGLNATVDLRAGATIEAEIKGRAATTSVTIAGVDMNASVEGRAKVSAELLAQANGTATITRDPPTAILKGSAGASAVVKAEGDLKFAAGPFSVVASGYASAGAEATASGVFGYEDGKLKIGGSLGAAFGVGLGGSATVEVDVRQISEMAKNVADVNNDGKVDLWDGVAAVGKTAKWASSWITPSMPGLPTPRPADLVRTTPVFFSPPMVQLWRPWPVPKIFDPANAR
jgi:hypothetical protein